MEFEQSASIVISFLLLGFLLFLSLFGKNFLLKNGGIIAGLGFFTILNLVYFSTEPTEKNTDYDYVFCRHIAEITVPLAVLLSLNYLVLCLILIYNRFGKLVPKLVFMIILSLALLIVMGFTMHYANEIHSFIAGLYAILFSSIFSYMYDYIPWLIWIVILASFVVVTLIRNLYYHFTETKWNTGLDLAFSLLTYATYLIIVFTPLIYNHCRKLVFSNERNEKIRRKGLIPVGVALVVIIVIVLILKNFT